MVSAPRLTVNRTGGAAAPASEPAEKKSAASYENDNEKVKKTARAAAIEALRGTMRVLIGILEDKLAPDDARWADFGLNQPAADTTPAAPIGVTATVVDGAPVRWLRGTQACRFHATGSLALSASCGLTARQPHQSAKSAALQVTMQMPHQTPHSPQPSVNASV